MVGGRGNLGLVLWGWMAWERGRESENERTVSFEFGGGWATGMGAGRWNNKFVFNLLPYLVQTQFRFPLSPILLIHKHNFHSWKQSNLIGCILILYPFNCFRQNGYMNKQLNIYLLDSSGYIMNKQFKNYLFIQLFLGTSHPMKSIPQENVFHCKSICAQQILR